MTTLTIRPELADISLTHTEDKLLARVVEALKNWDHDTAKEPWSRLIESRIQHEGIPGDLEIKHLIWMALRQACLTCASRGEDDYLMLVENLATSADDADVEDMELHINIDKQQQLAQMVFTISKKLYDTARTIMARKA